MLQKVDALVVNAGQLCTMPTHNHGPQRGHKLGDLGLIRHGAVALQDGKILAVGTTDEFLKLYHSHNLIDARGNLVTPGLIDAHTHVVWAGERAAEFERRVQGATYMEIMAEGGGINSTMRQTRAADLATLIEQSMPRVVRMMQHGATTIECKTGYGLDTATEINMLHAIAILDAELLSVDLVPTFTGAHAIPPEYKGRTDAYVDLVIKDMLPTVAQWRDEHWPHEMFVDVFCEEGVFDLEQSRRILEAAKFAKFGLKLHADEFVALGGTAMAVELGATSVDHLVVTPPDDRQKLAQSSTIGVSMPPTPFGLGKPHYTDMRSFLDADAAMVIATDCNPGTAWCENMQFVMALATRYLHLTPAQALACSTVNAAFAIGRGGRIGTLAEDTQADIVIWQVDDYRHLGYRFGSNMVQKVIKHGSVVFDNRTL